MVSTAHVTGAQTSRLVPGPQEFVAEAARVTNEADVVAAAALYAPQATMRVIFDGAEEIHRGQVQIRAAWQAYFPSLQKHGFRVQKKLVAADGDTIVNDWSGELNGRNNSYGLEVWKFHERLVQDHLLVGYLDLRPSETPKARLRLGISSPRLGWTLLRASQAAKKSS